MAAYQVLAIATDRRSWLQLRQQGLGGSDAGAILGVNHRKTPAHVLHDKLNTEVVEAANDAIRFGTLFERHIVARVSQEYAFATLDPGDALGTLQSVARPWQLANIDGRLSRDGADYGVGIEVKTCDAYAHGRWSRGIPAPYYAQVQHYMSVLGWERFDLWLCVAHSDRGKLLREHARAEDPDAYAEQMIQRCVLERYEIPRHEAYIERLNRMEEAFWARVEAARAQAAS